MKMMKRVFCGLLVALVASLAIAVLPAYADDATYKVRVWGGNEGTFDGQTGAGYAEQTFAYGDTVNLLSAFGEATVTDEKYYFRGFRVSGEDSLTGSATVTSDLDFVAAYGVKGEMVPYTLHFVEYNNTGNVLAAPQTYYGKVGDKPVAAFEYIEGYRPRYRNITATLKSSGNDWTFEYIPLAEGENEAGTTTVTTTTTTAAAGAAGAAGAAAATPAAGAAAGAAASEGAASAAAAAAEQTPPATEEIIDEDNVALASGEEEESTSSEPSSTGIPLAGIFGIAAAVVVLLGAVGYVIVRRRQDTY